MTSQNNLEERLSSAEEECERLRGENAGLRVMLGIRNSTAETKSLRIGQYHGLFSANLMEITISDPSWTPTENAGGWQ